MDGRFQFKIPDAIKLSPAAQEISDRLDLIAQEQAGIREHLLRKLFLEYYLCDITKIRLVEDRRDPLQTRWYFESISDELAEVAGHDPDEQGAAGGGGE